MAELVNRMVWRADADPELLLQREWLVTNGLGGYASGTVSGACTRRFHALLVAALPAPLGRMVMLTHIAEELRIPGGRFVALGGEELAGGDLSLPGAGALTEFRLEHGLPVWRYEVEGVVIEKRLLLPHQQNTVHVTYRLLEAPGPVRLRLRPSLHFRPHEGRVDATRHAPYRVEARGPRWEVQAEGDVPPLRLLLCGKGAALVLDGGRFREYLYRVEASRGYDARGHLWSPGYVRADLEVGRAVTLVASTETWDTLEALDPRTAREAEEDRRQRLLRLADARVREGMAGELVLAADQFIVTPASRVGHAARARASGDEIRTVIAGYHWFTDWGRDTMISLEGLALNTGRHREAGRILRTFVAYVKDGLLPNLFPEHDGEGLYHTADATLWLFHALNRYVACTGDRHTLNAVLPVLVDIIDWHLRGTRFGIRVDPRDGLLSQGEVGYQLTWMDAKVDDWVVTPRRGKAVEINALWYNALRLMEGWLREAGDEDRAAALADQADRTRASFNERFWYARGNHLYDVIDGEAGDDPALRPNQVLALALDHPVLDQGRWAPVMEVVERELLTPVGLRSLARSHPDYRQRYDGDLRSRDAAYHQGTVWGWLIGPFIDAWIRLNPERRTEARRFLTGFEAHMGEACLGSISEVFDAEDPFHSRGCIAQAWSVAEVLRCWAKTAG